MKKAPEKWAEIDRLGHEWFCSSDGNVRIRLANEIFILAYECLTHQLSDGTRGEDDYTDVLGVFYEKRFSRFDETIGPLSHYMKKQVRYLKKDQESSDSGEKKLTQKQDGSDDGVEERKKRERTSPISLDQPVSEDGQTLGERLPDKSMSGESPFDVLSVDESLLSMVTLMLELPTRLRGKTDNEARRAYYSMFFTDGISGYVQSTGMTPGLQKRERDVLSAMRLPFLDFFLHGICRSLREIRDAETRLHGEMVEGKPMVEPKRPFPWDVYISYLSSVEHRRVTAPALSMQRKAFQAFLCVGEKLPC